MNETDIIEKTIEELNPKDLSLTNLKYGNDSSGLQSVWLSFSVGDRATSQNDMIKKINNFSTQLKEELLKKGIDSWPYINFHERK